MSLKQKESYSDKRKYKIGERVVIRSKTNSLASFFVDYLYF